MNAIGIIGFGALGSALAEAVKKTGRLSWLLIRNESKHESASTVHVPILTQIADIPKNTDAIILAIPDKEIDAIAQQIHQMYNDEQACILIHCSGALRREVLFGQNSFFKAIAMHPFQSVQSVEDIASIPWGIECESDDRAIMSLFIESLNGIPFFLDEYTIQLKELYHATAVISANFLTILTAYSAELAAKANVPAGVFLPKIQSTVLDRAHQALQSQQSIIAGLTGPLIRMDESTIRAHRTAMASIPGMDALYCSISKAGIELLVKETLLTHQQADRLIEVLHEIPMSGKHAL